MKTIKITIKSLCSKIEFREAICDHERTSIYVSTEGQHYGETKPNANTQRQNRTNAYGENSYQSHLVKIFFISSTGAWLRAATQRHFPSSFFFLLKPRKFCQDLVLVDFDIISMAFAFHLCRIKSRRGVSSADYKGWPLIDVFQETTKMKPAVNSYLFSLHKTRNGGEKIWRNAKYWKLKTLRKLQGINVSPANQSNASEWNEYRRQTGQS